MKYASFAPKTALARRLKVTAVGIALALAMPAMVESMLPQPAQAAAMQKYLRMGVKKSVVLRLPRDASDVLIGDDEIVKAVIRSRRTVYIFARKIGQTNVFFLDDAGRQVLALEVEVSKDVRALQELYRRTLPNARIVVDMVGDKLVLRGTVRNAAELKQAMDLARKYAGQDANVVNALQMAGRDQVTIKVRIAEVQRSVAKQFGINWNKIITQGDYSIQMLMANPFSIGQALGYQGLTSKYPALSALGLTPPGVGVTNASGSTAAVLRALERDGLVRTLAEPTLTALSGESAKFLVGGEVPIPAAFDAGTQTVTYRMEPVGIILNFSPVVQSPGRITLKIKTEVSEVSSRYIQSMGGISVPGLEKRSAQTTVELPSGGTIALGGLVSDKMKQNIDGVPGIKNLPILGTLFRSRDFIRNQSELVIFATPYIVKPVNERKLRTPLDNLHVANDAQTILLGRLHRLYGPRSGGKEGPRVYHGDVGFIVE